MILRLGEKRCFMKNDWSVPSDDGENKMIGGFIRFCYREKKTPKKIYYHWNNMANNVELCQCIYGSMI